MPEEHTEAAAPRVIPRPEHIISRANISPNAIKVLYRLNNAGYQAYLVGGGVRDLLLGREPKDFDVATDARPEEVRALFRNSRLIGRRFRLAHVQFSGEIIEVATFRGSGEAVDEEGMEDDPDVPAAHRRILQDNVYGDLNEDIWRRDFTVNALYYNIEDFSILDQTGGMADLEAGRIRLIGDPEARYHEDPVRMLRAVRFAAKLGFRIESETEAPLFRLGPLLDDIPPARLFEEVLKLFMAGFAVQGFELLRRYGLFGHLFPQTEACLAREEGGFPLTLLARALENTDQRISEDRPVTPAFLFAALLWEPVRFRAERAVDEGVPVAQALTEAMKEVLSNQAARVSIPKRFSLPMREIWSLQPRFEHRQGRRAARLLHHPRFRAAYDFLLLRAEAGEASPETAAWWTELQAMDETAQNEALRGSGRPRRRRRRPKAQNVVE